MILPVPALIDRSVTPERAMERVEGAKHAGANADALAMHATPAGSNTEKHRITKQVHPTKATVAQRTNIGTIVLE